MGNDAIRSVRHRAIRRIVQRGASASITALAVAAQCCLAQGWDRTVRQRAPPRRPSARKVALEGAYGVQEPTLCSLLLDPVILPHGRRRRAPQQSGVGGRNVALFCDCDVYGAVLSTTTRLTLDRRNVGKDSLSDERRSPSCSIPGRHIPPRIIPWTQSNA
jgi:hypothetical protein